MIDRILILRSISRHLQVQKSLIVGMVKLPAASSFRGTVKVLSPSGDEVTLQAASDTKVGTLKHHYCVAMGLLPELHRMMRDHKELVDSQTLASYGIAGGSILSVEARGRADDRLLQAKDLENQSNSYASHEERIRQVGDAFAIFASEEEKRTVANQKMDCAAESALEGSCGLSTGPEPSLYEPHAVRDELGEYLNHSRQQRQHQRYDKHLIERRSPHDGKRIEHIEREAIGDLSIDESANLRSPGLSGDKPGHRRSPPHVHTPSVYLTARRKAEERFDVVGCGGAVLKTTKPRATLNQQRHHTGEMHDQNMQRVKTVSKAPHQSEAWRQGLVSESSIRAQPHAAPLDSMKTLGDEYQTRAGQRRPLSGCGERSTQGSELYNAGAACAQGRSGNETPMDGTLNHSRQDTRLREVRVPCTLTRGEIFSLGAPSDIFGLLDAGRRGSKAPS